MLFYSSKLVKLYYVSGIKIKCSHELSIMNFERVACIGWWFVSKLVHFFFYSFFTILFWRILLRMKVACMVVITMSPLTWLLSSGVMWCSPETPLAIRGPRSEQRNGNSLYLFTDQSINWVELEPFTEYWCNNCCCRWQRYASSVTRKKYSVYSRLTICSLQF